MDRVAQRSLLPTWYEQHLREFFLLLFTAQSDEPLLDRFSLEGRCELVIVEAQDCFQDLKLAMLPNAPKIVELNSEYVGKLTIGDKHEIFRAMLMLDNERALFIFSEVGQFSKEIEAWFTDQLEWSEISGDA